MATPQIPGNWHLGTCGWSYADWCGTVYEPDSTPGSWLEEYTTRYASVEVDTTFYRIPSATLVKGWKSKTPDDFVFSLKVPQEVTHQRILVDVEPVIVRFLEVTAPLGRKRGPLLFQFPYFNRTVFTSEGEFFARLEAVLARIPRDVRVVVELRNPKWVNPALLALLRAFGAILALTDQSWMPGVDEFRRMDDPVTGDGLYVRLLGDRKGIEGVTRTWDKVVVDREAAMDAWVDYLDELSARTPGMEVFVYANNHYNGHAPAAVERLRASLLRRRSG